LREVVSALEPVKQKLESHMSRTSLLVAVSGLALAACQPASEAPQELSAETPPVVEAVAEEAAAAAEEPAEAVTEAEADHDHEDEYDHADDDHEHDDDHGDEVHDHGDEHDHEDHAHEDAHDEDDHDHDDHDHAHAGGEAHVHGLSDLAASLDGAVLSINVEGALANFDLDESLRTLDDTTAYTDGTVAIIGGECSQTSAAASVRPIGDHGNLVIDWTYECADAGAIEAIDVIGFQSFAGFAEVNAIFLTGTDQTAETLTVSDTRLDLD
jgi:hypothetical protein